MDDRTANLLSAAVVALSDELEAACPPELRGQSAMRAAIATALSAPGVRIDELAAVVGVSGSGAVRLVDRLVGAGYAGRRRSETDGRSVTVWLTEDGAELGRALVAARRAVMARALAPLGEDGRRGVVDAIGPVLANLAGDRERADRICRLCDYAVCEQTTCPVEDSVR